VDEKTKFSGDKIKTDYSKKVVTLSSIEIQEHNNFLKKYLKKNNF